MENLKVENSINVQAGQLFYRSTEISNDRQTLLFLHGLGESGICFIEAFQEPDLQKYNILAPDLLGYGKSSRAFDNDYSFSAQIKRILDLLNKVGVQSVHLIGHSMGGDIGIKLCLQAPERILSFVNIEGDLTSGDRFITTKAIEAENQGRFDDWFYNEFLKGMVLEWSKKWTSCVRYGTSLAMCSTGAFRQNVHEIHQLNDKLPNFHYTQIGLDYRSINIPKIYCWGTDSLSSASRNFLETEKLANKSFSNSFHWVMIDKQEAFYHFLIGFLTSIETTHSLT